MARRSAIVIAASLLTVLIVPAIPAAAGGGCHTGATQGKGDTVELVDACPTPTILTIDAGGTVSFVNEDAFAHNVIGDAWVGGGRAAWIPVPHVLTVETEDGTETFSVRGNVLIWEVDGITYRLETSLDRASALEVARSIA